MAGWMNGWMDGRTGGWMDRICRSQWSRGLRRGSAVLACWDCGFESAGGMIVCLLRVLCVVK